MISRATLRRYSLPTGRAIRGNVTITITRHNGKKLAVPVQIVERPVLALIDWLAVAGFSTAALIAGLGMWL